MSREIKFRVFSKEGQLMMNWKDVLEAEDLVEFMQHYTEDGYYSHLMQFTGLKDENSVEIYEGDIINHCATFGYVIFEDGMFCLSSNAKVNFGYRQPLCYINTSKCKIIGNIYENYELLE